MAWTNIYRTRCCLGSLFTGLCLAGLFVGFGCSGVSSDPAGEQHLKDIQRLCDRAMECNSESWGRNVDECVTMIQGVEYKPGCVEAMVAAPCEEHDKPNPNYAALCWDSCEGETRMCIEERLEGCSKGYTFRISCELFCYVQELDYTGVCGESPPSGGQDLDFPICWCA